MYTKWMGKKMWAFGPAKTLIQKHVMTLKKFPTRGAVANNHKSIEDQANALMRK